MSSIRRIIHDDQHSVRDKTVSHRDGDPAHDVLILEQSMMVPADPSPAPMGSVPATPAPALAEPRPTEPPAAEPSPPAAPAASGAPAPTLVAPTTAAATASKVSELVRTLTTERNTAVSRPGLTIEDLVREEIKPLLKAWLDEHLPALVERAVQVEIERVIGRTVS